MVQLPQLLPLPILSNYSCITLKLRKKFDCLAKGVINSCITLMEESHRLCTAVTWTCVSVLQPSAQLLCNSQTGPSCSTLCPASSRFPCVPCILPVIACVFALLPGAAGPRLGRHLTHRPPSPPRNAQLSLKPSSHTFRMDVSSPGLTFSICFYVLLQHQDF